MRLNRGRKLSLFLLLCFTLFFAMTSTVFGGGEENCHSCTLQQDRIWCSMEHKCVNHVSHCYSSSVDDENQGTFDDWSNMFWFLKNYTMMKVVSNDTIEDSNDQDDSNNYGHEWISRIPQHCMDGIIDHPKKCPNFEGLFL